MNKKRLAVNLAIVALISVFGLIMLTKLWNPEHSATAATEGTQSIGTAASAARDPSISLRESQSSEIGKRTVVGIKAFTVDGNIPLLDGKARNIINDFSGRARNGDQDAALVIYMKLKSCSDARNLSINPSSLRTFEQAGIADQVLRSTEKSLLECEALSPDDYASTGRWLEHAADSGSVLAQLLYANDAASVIGPPSELLRDPGRVEQYKRKAELYLKTAAEKGSIEAMTTLSNFYVEGIMTRQDPVEAYAYYAAARRAYPQALPSKKLDALANGLSEQQLRSAQVLSNQLYRHCCD